MERYYYKDEKGNYYNYTKIYEGLIPITEAEWNEHVKTEEPSEKQKQIWAKNKEIIILKENLLATDYQAIKYAEGEITIQDYEAIKLQRRTWRIQINELEQQIKNIEN